MSAPRVLIAGGGPVGLALACLCEGFDVTVIEAAPAGAAPSEAIDLRVFALSVGSREVLKSIGAWERIDAARVARVRRMEIFGDRGARLEFAPPSGESLAWIVEGSRIAAALEESAAARPLIRIERGSAAQSFEAGPGGAIVRLEGGAQREAELLVGADGPDSRVRAAAGIEADERPYHEAAVVAHFETERAHEGIARQWFRSDGVLAWLPLPGRRISIVWSAPQAVAEELARLAPEALAARVREAGQSVLGEMRPLSATGRFPLRLIRVANPVAPGIALVGDAAHAVHPLAGQGMNLGFQDARILGDVLRGRSALERPGDARVLRRYARRRREDVVAMQWVTDSLDRLFSARTPGVAAVRNWGLGLVDRQGWIKRALAARAMR